MPTGYFWPLATADDGHAQEQNSSIDNTNSILYFDNENNAGIQAHPYIRFNNVNIPRNSTINSAIFYCIWQQYIILNSSTRYYRFYADKSVGDPGQIVSYADWGSRALTTAYVDWTVPGGLSAGTLISSPDIKTVIQEIVNQSVWSSGNHLQIVGRMQYVDSYGKAVRSYDYSPSNQGNHPRLYVDWTDPPPAPAGSNMMFFD